MRKFWKKKKKWKISKRINYFEKSFKKKEQVDANQLIEELFPEGKPLSEKDTGLKQKIEKLIEEMNKSGNINTNTNQKENNEYSNNNKQVK